MISGPKHYAGPEDGGEVVSPRLFLTCAYLAEVLELVEEAVDQVALAAETGIDRPSRLPVGLDRDATAPAACGDQVRNRCLFGGPRRRQAEGRASSLRSGCGPLMGADDRVGDDLHAVGVFFGWRFKGLNPDPRDGPSLEAVMDGCAERIALRQIAQRRAGSQNPEDAAEYPAHPPDTRLVWKEGIDQRACLPPGDPRPFKCAACAATPSARRRPSPPPHRLGAS